MKPVHATSLGLPLVVCLAFWASRPGPLGAAEPPAPPTLTWSLRDDFRSGASRKNPNPDRDERPVWSFLRTTRSEGPVESRRWLRDGRYASLADAGEKLFGSPLDGWAFRAQPPLAPVIGRLAADYDVGLKFAPGDLLLAPGPDHAVVVGWRSPVAGKLEIAGSFEHGQSCCGDNSKIRWYVERGPGPNESSGFTPTLLASGESDFGTASQRADFQVRDQTVAPDDYIYFVVDAWSDGTATPHHGDATRFHVTVTVRDAVEPPPPSFEKDVLPLLAARCHDCHGGDLREGRLDLRTLSEILRGGENGPALVRGDPDASLVIDLVASGQMPPGDDDKLAPDELSRLRRWIKAGAPADERVVELPAHARVDEQDRAYWAFQPPRRSPPPAVRDTERVRTPIDRFVLSKLEQHGLSFSADAEQGALVRRVAFDLLGLPPDPEATRAFLEDDRPDAYERLVDELLSSPDYGRRWGRHWLDAAGYVDGKLDNDLGTIYPSNGAWRYRDYVLQAFNDDLPFDRFLTEQIAGDELVDWRRAAQFDSRTVSLLSATGFLRNVDDHTDFPQYGIEKRVEVVNETLDMFSTAVLGLTMDCCRCHNHKYDPLPQRDYYRLLACFEPAYNVHAWKPPKDRHLPDVSPAERAEIDRLNTELDAQAAELSKGEAATRERVRQRLLDSRLAALPDEARGDLKQAIATAPDKRTDAQKALVAKHEALIKIADADLNAAFDASEQASLKASVERRAALVAQKRSYGVIQALWDVGPPPVSHVHRRGDVKARGVLVQPGFPEVLQPAGRTAPAAAPDVQGESSGRRLALARWLTRLEHPLTARVFVNRVWHHHFGRGIVETLGNFGRSGAPPSHPELLDWLAVDFMEHGWSVKRLHRQILLSTAYRQSSRRPPRGVPDASGEAIGERVDPDNRLLWRMNLRRLEAEIVRDAVLAASGSLDRAAGGPPVEITNPPDGLSEVKLSEVKAGPQSSGPRRRSVYLFARRVYPLKFLEIFDAPIMPVNCTQRTHSATVLQSLALLNSEFLFAQAEALAARIAPTSDVTDEQCVSAGFQCALGRAPTANELAASVEFLQEQQRELASPPLSTEQARRRALADFCQMLMASNEFLYVE